MGIAINWINGNIKKYGGFATLMNGDRVPVLQVRRVEYIREAQLQDESWVPIRKIEWDMDGYSFYSHTANEIG